MAKNITARKENFSQWYQDVIQAGELADHSPVRGCMVIRPVGFAIWENTQQILNRMFKETGHSNAYFPLLIPESFINKESQHVEGFAPELAVVTHGGGNKLEEPLVVRPTSETIIGAMYSKWIKSHRDLPVLINLWNNVMRWEMRTRLFLRTTEFLWQEGHTAHATYQESQQETLQMAEIYRKFLEDYCAIPVLTGLKPEHERFPGALATYTLEAMMQDKKALQSATSHNLGQNFSKAFQIRFLDKENQLQYAWTTSWGISTRIIGGIIMTHADDDGIILPPNIAEKKVVIVPIYKNDTEKEKVEKYVAKATEKIASVIDKLSIQIDKQTDLRPVDRFFYWIQRGIPIRIEIGLRDIEKNNVILCRRDNKEKMVVSIDNLGNQIKKQLESIQTTLFNNALALRKQNTVQIEEFTKMEEFFKNKGGFVEAYWDGSKETAANIQQKTKATIRLILESDKEKIKNKLCIYSKKQAKYKVCFSLAY